MNKKIAIVIITYNAQDYLPDLFDSLLKQTYPKDLTEIIIIDNASRDETVECIRKFKIQNEIKHCSEMKSKDLKPTIRNLEFSFLDVKLIENKENLGFAKGNNIGIKEALKTCPDYLVFLNQDMVVESGWLEKLVEEVETDERTAVVQPMILLWDEKDKIQTSGNKIHYLGFGYSGDYRESLISCQFSVISYASGAAALVKREVLEKIEGFDGDLWAYHEDLDLGWYIRLLGYEIKRARQSIVYHKYSFTKEKSKYYFMERNRLIVLLKYYKTKTLILIFPTFLFMEISLWIFALVKGWVREKLKSYKDFLVELKYTLVKRNQIQKLRKVGDKEVIKYFVGKIEFEDIDNFFLKYIVNPILDFYWRIIKKIIVW